MYVKSFYSSVTNIRNKTNMLKTVKTSAFLKSAGDPHQKCGSPVPV
ncbi:protein of unknown function [Tenacibaculum jejuense]|uniref:Uncharacterized protein n=1 Tax=Tenacibaculum jejuense TaxID=584609 RepID=A0A238UB74_9FLAO|nr:protein of unknown function [Tenacibaculum jejuense]